MDPRAAILADALLDARSRTLALVADLSEEQWVGPRLPIVNPPRWEIGHVAWFQEKWTLRYLGALPPTRADGDALYDSAEVHHDTRWRIPLPSREDTFAFMQTTLDRVLERLAGGKPGFEDEYFHRLVLFHEDMHGEALVYTRQTLGYAAPRTICASRRGGGPLEGDVEVPGGKHALGAERSASFVFDNEKWAHAVEVKPFAIARAPVTQAHFAMFVEEGGYRRNELWSEDGRRWRNEVRAEQPLYWRRGVGNRWMRLHYDHLVPLEEHRPMIHVNWHEAEAYCRWAGRRLPTEVEWEIAASGEPNRRGLALAERKRLFPWGSDPPDPACAHLDLESDGCVDVGAYELGDSAFGCRQMIGNVWEWTATTFGPYPGFVVDPYREYSQPWFGTHKVLRGGCFATRSRLIRNTWRNFYTPDRRDVLAGFRTVAL
jgi:iron(II)-dependent oxidoreductase